MIRITRASQYADGARAYRIVIDGVERGKIKRGETKEFEVENGVHTVCAKMDWCGSPELCVEVNDSVVELVVGNALIGVKHLLSGLYMTVWRNKYLFLIEKSEYDKLPRY